MKYRPEIDGLRTLAVVPVILFHAGFELFSGGYVGVDVFFVISGYLITTILINEHDEGRFSLVGFYERRARRILPALFFVILCCLPFAWIWLLPDDLIDFGKSLLATALFSSNIYFWMDSDYFATANELKPLLHTWSLAVEEQFYIFFPLVLMMFWRFQRWVLISILIGAFVLSLGVSHWAAFNQPEANFYLLPTRAWELLIGSFCAFWLQKRALPTASPLSQMLGLSGIGLILYSIVFFDGNTPFPSLYALAPTVGTALIILFAAKDTLAGKLLSLKPMVGIGLISYSAYLWHQPIFAFARHRSLLEPDPVLMLALSAMSVGLAFMSWRFVEAPFRNRALVSRNKILSWSFWGLTTCAAISMIFIAFNGISIRFGHKLNQIATVQAVSDKEYTGKNMHPCHFGFFSREQHEIDETQLAECLSGDDYIFLVGDSHAAFLGPTLAKSLTRYDITLISFTKYGCLPVRGLLRKPFQSEFSATCSAFNDDIFKILKEHPAPIVISTRWRLALSGTGYDNGEGGRELGADVGPVYPVGDTNAGLLEIITKELKELSSNSQLIIVDQIPEAGWNVPDLMIKRSLFSDDQKVLDTSYQKYLIENKIVLELMSNLNQFATVIPAAQIVCDTNSGRCLNEMSGLPLYFDDDHPSDLLSGMIVERIEYALNDVRQTSMPP